MAVHVPRATARPAPASNREAARPAAHMPPAQRNETGAADAFAQSLNEGAAARALAQLRATLDHSPRVQRQAALLRELNRDEETVAQPAGGAGPNVFQFARVNVRRDGSNTISGVSAWPHRPPSNVRGSQGQHLTAYVSFEDMILSHVRDRTVPQAANALSELIDTIDERLGSPTWRREHGAAANENKRLLGIAARDNDADLLGDIINNILALRNVIPDTAIGTAEQTWGHGESRTSGNLEVLETILRQAGGDLPETYDEDTQANAALYNMWRLLDYQPPSGASEAAFNKTKDRVYRHLLQMRLSYPMVFDWLSANGYRLLSYIKDNRDEDKMPLTDLSDEEIDEITNYIMG